VAGAAPRWLSPMTWTGEGSTPGILASSRSLYKRPGPAQHSPHAALARRRHRTTPMTARRTITEFRVRYAETDQMGVVYHSHYLVWCEMGRTDYIRALGKTYAQLEREGVGLAVADASIRYHAPARYDDRVRVETTLESVRSRAITFDYLITNADTGDRLVSARTTLVSIDDAGRPVALPPETRELLGRTPP
jgi:acyl-CoA thioester hydrolase